MLRLCGLVLPVLGGRRPMCYRLSGVGNALREQAGIVSGRALKARERDSSMPVTNASRSPSADLFTVPLAQSDPEIADAISRELGRQRDEIELIASENIVSRAVLEAQGSVLTNKYAEGAPGKRYYGGCQFVDIVEQLAIDRVTKLFGCKF